MARLLHLTQIPLSTSQAGLAAVTLLLCAFTLFKCASHSRKWSRGAFCSSPNHTPVIQLNTEAMMPNNNNEQQLQVPVWQKNILMGGKCQLPDFSGVIIYDSDGNPVTQKKTPRPLLTWK